MLSKQATSDSSPLRRFATALTFLLPIALAGCRDAASPPFGASDPPQAGAVVTFVEPGGNGDAYGLEVGDVLTAWEGRAAAAIDDPFEALRVQAEEAPLGEGALVVFRRDSELRLPVRGGGWDVELQYVLGAENARSDRQAWVELEERPRDAAQFWQELATQVAAEDARRAAWFQSLAGRALIAAGEPDEAEQALESANLASGALPPALLAALHELEARSWKAAAERPRAEVAAAKSVAMRRAGSPDSLALAQALVSLGHAARVPVPHEGALLEADALFERWAPGGPDQAEALNLLGNVAFYQSDLTRALGYYERALALRQRAGLSSLKIADVQTNLGLIAGSQGRLDDAEELLRTALDGFGEEFPHAAAIASNLLAVVERNKGNYGAARKAWEFSLAVFREERPGSLDVAGVLNNLGNLARTVGDLERAQALHVEALALRRELVPEGRDVALSLTNLGIIAQLRGNLVDARAYLEESLALKERVARGSLTHANALIELAEISRAEGDSLQAELRVREGLEIRRSSGRNTLPVAEGLVLLGRVLFDVGQPAEGESAWREGLDILDARRAGFRYSAQQRSIFGSRYQEHYRDLAAKLVALGEDRAAFELLERSRARALRAMVLSAESEEPAPSEPDSPVPPERPPLSLDEVRASLDPETTMIVFSVGRTETLVATVRAARSGEPGPEAGVTFHSVEISRSELEQRVSILRALIERGRESPGVEPGLVKQGARLYRLLFGPVEAELASASRLLIVADKPLYVLPFVALVRQVEPLVFAGAWKPMTFSASATVFAEAKSRRGAHPSEPSITIYARSAADESAPEPGGRSRPPLPGVEREARELAELFGARAKVSLNSEALEATVAEDAVRGGYLHFATHTQLDQGSPLDSALVLEPGRGEDGLLHAHEILEWRGIESDLVTLSACSTGMGFELAGEGVLGLSHAFLFAGSRTIVTSLWPVADQSTALWMRHFYEGLAEGLDRDEAMTRAQAYVMDLPGRAHPYYWAAFQLWGDWDR